MATLASRISDLASAIGTDIKSINDNAGTLSSLTTTEKASLVGAINEINTVIQSASEINDAAVDGDTTSTYSVDKILELIETAKTTVKNDLVNGSAAALDTLSELATALGNDPDFATTITTALANRVRFDAAQTLTALEKTQACGNIGIGEPDTNFVTPYTTARDAV